MDEELKQKNLQLYQQTLLDNQDNSNELIVVPQYKEDGTMSFKQLPNKKEAMELGANDPLFLALTAGTQAGKEALKGAYNLGVKGFTKLQPYLNIMSPGTKEFMTMLNSGIPGKIASGAVTAAEGYWINEAIKQAKENPNIGNIAMAGLSMLPYTNGAAQAVTNGWFNLAKNSKPLQNLTFSAVGAWDDLMDNINKIGQNIKKAGVKFNKWWNADKVKSTLKYLDDVALKNITPYRNYKVTKPVNKLTSHLQGDDAVKMFKEYSKDYVLPTTETENIRQLRAYIPEVRERYDLVGNNKVSDDDILKALYKQVSELDGGTAARNIDGEPQLLFRGDTKRYTELKPRVSPEELVTMSGTMDNSLGTLFLGELPGTGVKGQGLERYLVHGREFNGNKRLIGSGTGAHVVSPSGDRISEFDAVASFPHGSRYLVTHTTSRGIPHSYYKLPSTYSSTGVNDINGFVVRTPNMRNASKEISVLNDDFLVQASPDKVSYYGPKRRVQLDKDGFPLLVDESGNVVGNALAGSSERSAMAQHYRYVLDDAKLYNQGLLKSEGGSTNGIPGNYLRDEHTHFNYFALPNFNIRNAKHILPYDFRVPRDWNDPNIYKVALPLIGIGGVGLTLGNNTESYKQGGLIKKGVNLK